LTIDWEPRNRRLIRQQLFCHDARHSSRQAMSWRRPVSGHIRGGADL